MWSNEASVQTSASPEQIWRLWADVESWPDWNDDIERIELIGDFEAGSRILMTPFGEEEVERVIAELDEPETFVDEVDFGDVVVRTIHTARRLESGRTRVTYRLEITGLAADVLGPEIGPLISGDFPQVIAALVARAEM
jgi:uncharacterized protein YndB with AHSA1/START domain